MLPPFLFVLVIPKYEGSIISIGSSMWGGRRDDFLRYTENQLLLSGDVAFLYSKRDMRTRVRAWRGLSSYM